MLLGSRPDPLTAQAYVPGLLGVLAADVSENRPRCAGSLTWEATQALLELVNSKGLQEMPPLASRQD